LAFRTEEEFSDGYGSDETIGGDDDDDGKINER